MKPFGTCYSVQLTVCYAGAYASAYQSGMQNKKYQVSHKYSCSSRWQTWRGPKHV